MDKDVPDFIVKLLKVIDSPDQFRAHLDQLKQERPSRLLFFVNPHGGKGKAVKIFKRQVKPLLELAQVDYKLIVTQYANHAREIIQDPSFALDGQFDGLVGVGGDGMFAELMNGLLFRYNNLVDNSKQAEDDIISEHDTTTTTTSTDDATTHSKLQQQQQKQSFKTPPIPIGIIGAGSTDANCFGFFGTNDVIIATLNIILANQIKIDVCSLHSYHSDKLLRFASTFAAYGYFGDIIRESEKLRWLGPSRYNLSGFNNLLKHRKYNGHLRVLVSEADGSPLDEDRCSHDCPVCAQQQQHQPRYTTQNDDSLDDTCSAASTSSAATSTNDNHHSSPAPKLKLVELEGPFLGVNAAVTACRCPQTRKGFSPSQHRGNGCADLIVVRRCSRLQYLRYLMRTGYSQKSPFTLPYVDALRCREFEFIVKDAPASTSSSAACLKTNAPQDNNKQSSKLSSSGAASSWNVDGEILRDCSIRVRVNNKLLNVFGIM